MLRMLKGALHTAARVVLARVRISAKFAWFALAAVALMCVALAIVLPKYTSHPLEFKLVPTALGTVPDPWEQAHGINSQMPYKVVMELSPEHLHMGEEFSLAVHVFWMPDEGEISWEQFINSLKLPSFVWARDVQEYREVRGAVHYVCYTHTLQVVGDVTFGNPYKIEFEKFAWRQKSSDAFVVKPQRTDMFVVPRYAEHATPRLSPLAGPLYPLHTWARNALGGVSAVSVVLAVMYATSALWQLRSKAVAFSLDERYGLIRMNVSEPRKTLFALEEIAGTILLERDENPVDLWHGHRPVWQQPAWERMWPIFAKAYQSTEPNVQDARDAYILVGTLLKARKREKKR